MLTAEYGGTELFRKCFEILQNVKLVATVKTSHQKSNTFKSCKK